MYTGIWRFRGHSDRFGSGHALQASKTSLDVHDRGLHGASGAAYVIDLLQRTPTIQHLVIGNNPLGDEGTVKLFSYLKGPGNIHRLVEISLNSCRVGNLGLAAIASYVDGNDHLQLLLLQNNKFNPSWALCTAFTNALNNSRVGCLSLTSNPQLSDTFLFRFLPNLSTPYLRVLQLSAMGLTNISTPYLISFLSTDHIPETTKPRKNETRLVDLRLNGNDLTLRCVNAVVEVIQRHNFSLRHLELHANKLEDLPVGDDSPEEPILTPWSQLQQQLTLVYGRNHLLSQLAETSARRLLPPARALLLRDESAGFNSPWRRLPAELQHYILSLMYNGLSPSQYIRIWAFASNKTTLPPPRHYSLFSLFQAAISIKAKEDCLSEYLRDVGCDRFEWHVGWEQALAAPWRT